MVDATKRVTVVGTVQGVGFRAWTRRQAERLGVSGWVRNERDGSVSALFHGDADAVARMLAAIEQGPVGAEVSQISIDDAEPPTDRGFAILR